MAIDDQIDLMTEEEMDLGTDPEFQDILKQLGADEAQALMQLIKEYKEMIAQGFQGEFEDFVRIKMSTAQGYDDDDINEFQSEDEMIIEPDEMMDIEKQIVPTEMVAEGGRIDPPKLGNPPVIEKIDNMREWRIANPDVEDVADYKGYYERLKNPEDYDEHGWKKKRKKKQEGGIMDIIEDEEVVETGPSRQEMIMDYLRQRGLPITPENIQKAIIEMITGGIPYTEEASYDMPQMDRPSVLPRGMMVDETITERTPRSMVSLTEDVMTPPIKPYIYDAPIDAQPWDTPQSTMFAAEGGFADDAAVISKVSPSHQAQIQGNQMAEDAINEIMMKFYERFPGADEETTLEDMVAMMQAEGVIETEGLGILGLARTMDMITPESVRRSAQAIGRHHFQEGGPVSDEEALIQLYMDELGLTRAQAEIKARTSWDDPSAQKQFDDFNWGGAEGGIAGLRQGYFLGKIVKAVTKPIKKVGSKLVKSVKKFAKSDLGKAALMYMATAGAANIGAGGGMKGLFKLGTYNPATVGSNIASSWTNLKGMFPKASTASTPKVQVKNILKDAIGMPQNLSLPASVAANTTAVAGAGTGIMSKLATSFVDNPMPWILGASLAGGAYTKANPGEENLDRLMAERNREVADWDDTMANIRSGEIVTPFTTGNVKFPYPNYYLNVANGGRINYKHGGSHWYNPLSWFSSDDVEAKILGEDVVEKQDKKKKRLKELEKELGIKKAEGGIMNLGGMEKDYRETGGFVPIGEYEKKDDVPARLSLNEFVMTADAVRGAGNGDVDKGAEVMEDMMETLEEQGKRHRQAKDMFSVSERLSEVVN